MAVLFTSITKLLLVNTLSKYNAPSSAITSVVWNVLVGSVISIYLLCPACVLFVTFSLAIFVFLLSIAMMCLSGKYFKNPVSNTRSYTPWTWWKLKEKFENNERKQLEKYYRKCI